MHFSHKSIMDQFENPPAGFSPAGSDWSNRQAILGLTTIPSVPGIIDLLPGKPLQNGEAVLFDPDASTMGHSNAAGAGSYTGSGSTTASSATTGLTINITWDASVASAPSGFTSGILSAARYLETQFSNAVTININVGYGEVNGTTLASGTLGASEWYLDSMGYSQLASALWASATTSEAQSAAASLPSLAPVNGTFWTTSAQAKALGAAPSSGSSTDGYIGFSSSCPFTYDDTNGCPTGTYDFTGTVIHEISEVMGRALLTGSTIGSTPNSYSAYDLLHYSAPGARDFSATTPGYFSIDGGITNLAAFNTQSGGDAGDWASSVTSDAFDAFSSSGVVNSVSSVDLIALNAIGWKRASGMTSPATLAAPPPAPGLTATDMTTGQPASSNVQPYSGPVPGLQEEYINITADNLNIEASTDNWFIHSGSGTDAISVHGGTNVLDGGSGSNFLTGGSGTDTFFVDDRAANTDTWSTIVGFHAGDAVTIWGVTPQDFAFNWFDNQGATGYTGLTLHATAAGKPTASITLVGYSSSDMNAGRFYIQYGTDSASASSYMYIRCNG